jgi:hypothetical protein
MASILTTKTRRATRDKIAKLTKGNHELTVMLENLADDVGTAIPLALDEVLLSALLSLSGADGAKGTSQRALGLVLEVQAVTAACQRLTGDVNALRGQIDLLRLELQQANARLSSSVNRAQAAANEALTLAIGV